MANAVRGEASIEIGGRDYTLRVSMHAYALAQDALTKGAKVPTLEDINQRMQAGHVLTAIAMFWASLQKHHPEVDTLDAATELLEQSAGKASVALAEAIKRSAPDAADTRELTGARANPPSAQAGKKRGTGVTPTSTPAASA